MDELIKKIYEELCSATYYDYENRTSFHILLNNEEKKRTYEIIKDVIKSYYDNNATGNIFREKAILEAKVYAYEQIIENSNFKAILSKDKETLKKKVESLEKDIEIYRKNIAIAEERAAEAQKKVQYGTSESISN